MNSGELATLKLLIGGFGCRINITSGFPCYTTVTCRWVATHGRLSLAESDGKTASARNQAKDVYPNLAIDGPLLQPSQLRDYTPDAQG